MTTFTVWDSRSGEILRTGSCPESDFEHQTRHDWEWICEGKHDWRTERHDGEQWIAKDPPPIPAPDYREMRRNEYPDVGEQLDAIWKQLASDKSLLVGDAETMLTRVMEVKAKHPKP